MAYPQNPQNPQQYGTPYNNGTGGHAPPFGGGAYPNFPPQQQPGYGPPGYPQPQGYQPQQPGYPQAPQGQGYHGGPPQQGGYMPAGYPAPGPFPQGQYGGPVVQQPMIGGPGMQPGGWMNIPQGLSNCPPGLEYLSTIDQLLVHQKVELLEALIGFETNNKFTIKNSLGQKVYYAVEENDCCTRNCCGPLRPFDMKILDTYRNQVMHLHRPLACDSCCCPCCLQSMEVSSPPGTIIGYIEQEWSIFKPSFSIKNASGEIVLKISGPLCTYSICGEVEFKVLSADGETEVGKIRKQWSGLLREMFTDTDYFGITFPMDLDVRMKAVMLGACFLIDAMFFEKSGNTETDGPGML